MRYHEIFVNISLAYSVNIVRDCRLIEISENKVFGETLVLSKPK